MTPRIEICRLVIQGREEDSSSYTRSEYALKTQGRMLPVVLSFDTMDDACAWLDWAQSQAAVHTLPSCAIHDLVEDWLRLLAEQHHKHAELGGEG